jgi:hypothetical protein
MSGNITDTIAGLLTGLCSPMCGPKFCPCNEQAKSLVAALQADRIALVKLPEPDPEPWDECDLANYTAQLAHTTIRIHHSGDIIHDNTWYTPAEARDVAAALLAGADQAEANK